MSEESRRGPWAINVAAGLWQAWQGQLDDLTVAGPRPEAHAQYNKHALDLRTAAPPMMGKGKSLLESKTLPKAQRTRGLNSSCQSNYLRLYHKFKHKS